LAGAQAPAEARAGSRATRQDVAVKDIEAAQHNDWFGIYYQKKKVGFMNDAFERRTEKGQTYYRVRTQSQLKLLTYGRKGEIKEEQLLDFADRPPFALQRAEYVVDDGNSRRHVKLVAQHQGYQATMTIGKATRTKVLNGVDLTLADVLSPAAWLQKGPAKGDTITLRDFDFNELKMSSVSMKLLDIRPIGPSGATLYEVEKAEPQSKVTSVLRVDSKARIISGNVIGLFEIRRESESEAKNIEFTSDLLADFMAKLDRPVGGLQDLSKVILKKSNVNGLILRGKGEAYGLLPNTAMQTITRDGDNVYTIKIGKHHGTKVKATAKEIQEALAESMTYPTKDAKVIELARKAIGDARTDQEKVERLCKFVHEYIKYEVVLVPKVHDIIERKVGDCKSYALLFTSLARAVGLPARETSGYFYMGDEVKGFGGHAWNEVVIDGHWVPVDATLGHTQLLPFYICVGDNMSQTNGKLAFQLVEVERTQ
jgi:hypothetical protein